MTRDHATSRDRSFPTIAVSISFWIWCALVSYPLIMERVDLIDPDHPFIVNPIILACQATGLLLFLATTCAAYLTRFNAAIGRLNHTQIGIFVVIYLSFALQLHDKEAAIVAGLLYTALMMLMALALCVLWTMPLADLERCLHVASIVLCLFSITAIAILGWPVGRNVGSIQPNLFAAPLLVGFIFSQFRPGLVGVIVRFVCLAMVALVSSRFALIGCLVAFVLYKLTFDPLNPARIPALAVAALAAVFLWPQIASILALDDSARDLSSGFSGRDQLWSSALAAIAEHPFGIGFKRSIGVEAGHNGYLKTLVEFGVLGGGLILFFVACNIVFAGLDAISTAGKTPQQRRFACARFGGLAALAFGAFFQPQLLNLGDAFAMSFLFLLFRPRMISISERALPARAGRQPAHFV